MNILNLTMTLSQRCPGKTLSLLFPQLTYCLLYFRLAEICEVETENYLKMDPDPFDERHPSRADPDCKLGQILKALFKKDNFMNKVQSRKLFIVI